MDNTHPIGPTDMKHTDSKKKIRVNLTPLFAFMKRKGVTQGYVANELEVSKQTISVNWKRGLMTEERLWQLYVAVKYATEPKDEAELDRAMEAVLKCQEEEQPPGQFNKVPRRDMIKLLDFLKKHRYTVSSVARAGKWTSPSRVKNLLVADRITDASYDRMMEAVYEVVKDNPQALKELRQLERELD